MADLLADISALERAVADLLATVGAEAVPEATMRRAATDALVAWLADKGYSAADLLTPAVQVEIATLLRESLDTYDDELRRAIADAVQANAERVERFYTARGIDVTDLRLAAARSEVAARLSEAFDAGMKSVRRELYEATTEIVMEAVLSGQLDSAAIREQIDARTRTGTTKARMQTMAAVGAFNQAHRLVIAERAGLDHYLYSGTIKDNTRLFCRLCLGRVFRADQIAELRNGLLEPVMLYKGGFRCRHSWLAVNPTWDERLAAAVLDDDATAHVLPLNRSGSRTMTVLLTPDEAAQVTRTPPTDGSSL